jgi:uncharacterized membrane protein
MISQDYGPIWRRQEINPESDRLLESILRSSGIDPRNPQVSRALEISLSTMMFSGSLPLVPPPILQEYGNIRPELVDKLIDWTEKQATHRRELERLRTEGSEKRLNRSQWIGAIVAVTGLALSAIVANHSATAIAIALVAIGGPTAAIWLAHNTRRSSPAPPTPTIPAPPSPPTTKVS